VVLVQLAVGAPRVQVDVMMGPPQVHKVAATRQGLERKAARTVAQVHVVATQVRVAATRVLVAATQVRVAATRVLVAATQVRVDATRVLVAATQVQLAATVVVA